MEVYYCIFILSFLLCIFDFTKIRVFTLFVYVCFVLFITVFVGCRKVGVDNDSITYQWMYNLYKESDILEILCGGGFGYVEKGYVFLNKIVAELGGNFRNVIFIMALLTSFANYTFFVKKSFLPFLSLLFYLSFFILYRDFTQIRYAFSCALCFWAVYFYIDEKYGYTTLFLVSAILFHNTAIVLIPVLFFIRFVNVDKLYLALIIPALLVGYSINIFSYLLNKYFINVHMQIYQNEPGGAGLAISLVGCFIMILYQYINHIYKKKRYGEIKSREETVYYNLVSISVIVNFLFIQSAIFQRVSYLFFQFSILLLPIIFFKIKKLLKKRLFIFLYLLVTCFLLCYSFKIVDINLIRPYKMQF